MKGVNPPSSLAGGCLSQIHRSMCHPGGLRSSAPNPIPGHPTPLMMAAFTIQTSNAPLGRFQASLLGWYLHPFQKPAQSHLVPLLRYLNPYPKPSLLINRNPFPFVSNAKPVARSYLLPVKAVHNVRENVLNYLKSNARQNTCQCSRPPCLFSYWRFKSAPSQ
ncbi:MAG: hypothetical protein [Microvirus sp.]|nr:MAG: hypothetical protein [Microvirus sp.]